MAINKTFVEHSILKASDLNELVTQAYGYVHEVDVKKPDTIDISQYLSENDELPLGCYYVYYGNPTHTLAGRYTYTDTYFIAICISHWEHAHTLAVYTKNAQNKYIYYETFRTDQASTAMERYIAGLFAEPPVTYEQDGLMTHEDKQLFDDMVTEVFPLTVGINTSNARSYEVGDRVNPQIVLDITRKGADVSASATTTSSQGTVQSDNKTITDSQMTSGSKTFQISVSQGGQTAAVPDQTFIFMNYVYGFVVDSKPANAAAVIAAITNAQSVSSARTLSTSKTKSSTTLAANKYYIFAVQGANINLVCRHAETNGIVSGCTVYKDSTKLSIPRINGTGSDDYSAIIVEKSASSWNFKITNS